MIHAVSPGSAWNRVIVLLAAIVARCRVLHWHVRNERKHSNMKMIHFLCWSCGTRSTSTRQANSNNISSGGVTLRTEAVHRSTNKRSPS